MNRKDWTLPNTAKRLITWKLERLLDRTSFSVIPSGQDDKEKEIPRLAR